MSSLSINSIPSMCMLLSINELKHNDERIFNFEPTSFPLRSEEGFDSA